MAAGRSVRFYRCRKCRALTVAFPIVKSDGKPGFRWERGCTCQGSDGGGLDVDHGIGLVPVVDELEE